MKRLIDRLGLGEEFQIGSVVPLKVRELVTHLDIHDQIKVLTSAEMWRRGKVPKKYVSYAQTKTPNLDMVHFMTWQQSKEAGIIEELDSGITPDKVHPIHATLNLYSNRFSITDGITRIRIFNQRGIEYIPTKLFLDYHAY